MFEYAKPEQKQKDKSKSVVQKQKEQEHTMRPNLTGIPNATKERFKNISGFSFDDVRVHYNSNKPAQLQALAYTQGNQVYVVPGREKHLGHELGHVVQQKYGIAPPMMSIGGVAVNDDTGLEKETEVMRMKTSQVKSYPLDITQRKYLNEICMSQSPMVAQFVIKDELILQLQHANVKFDRAKLLFTVAAPSGIKTTAGVIFLEEGNDDAGWNHIQKHISDFEDHGIDVSNFSTILEKTIAKSPDSTKPANRGGTEASYFVNFGKINFNLNIVVANNGFIVTAFPEASSAKDYYKAISKDPDTFIKLGGLAGYEAGH